LTRGGGHGRALDDWLQAEREWEQARRAAIAAIAHRRYRDRVVGDWLAAEQDEPPAPADVVLPYEDQRVPLEALVERERARPAPAVPDPRQAAEAGLHFLRVLRVHGVEHYRDAYVARWPLRPPAPSGAAADGRNRRYLEVVDGRVIDGAALYAALRAAFPPAGGGALPAQPAVSEADRPRVTAAALAWLAWYERLFSEPAPGPSAWVPDRMEYTFAVAAPSTRGPAGEVVLAAREYSEGRLDWHSFDLEVPDQPLGAASRGTVAHEVRTLLPTPVTFAGMPASRWWEMEDRRVHFGAVDAAPDDLARLLLMEFALIYGNDFFVVPVELEVGSVCTLDPIVVTDTFGIRTLVQPHHPGTGAAWRMWSLSGDGAAGPVFFLPPALGPTLEGAPLEELVLLRDESANLAWAVERTVQGPAGLPAALHAPPGGPAATDEDRLPIGADGRLLYRLATPAPRNWYPLVPVRTPESGASVRLQRRWLPDPVTGQPLAPLGRLLAEGAGTLLHEEEVPREGARVIRAFQYARWTDGSTHRWVGRRKGPGRGEGTSGLRFDTVEPPPPQG
ncbi:MAG TPA: hypothetical protein VFQ76_01655, partial [Longimicrobiaceae bacterium]|nr:hypothetical protein [Longimicrobiaceae bacterium]